MEMLMVRRPDDMNAFEFVVVAGLRAAQLHRGCTARVDPSPKVAVTAQHEVANRKVLPFRTAGPFAAATD
jgi:DNA-directed RNA polymerase subunit K/omega